MVRYKFRFLHIFENVFLSIKLYNDYKYQKYAERPSNRKTIFIQQLLRDKRDEVESMEGEKWIAVLIFVYLFVVMGLIFMVWT
ncbi:hypothetical protein B7C51_07580 [Paenibacillus larvae subsp. pulvifaciens]|uniref:Uncharacterized protein n=1 Tax=Paenibacillus larvae subsp. pulvifaciens TaxID=1477 RepID=A0A1V0UR12_9BACL|nr:hypothetical protein B7C51_07580 [Paenibacillus larvae subsp. pulvifaciens]